MSKSDAFETALLQHIFQNATIANVGDATGVRGSTAAGSLFLSLHTADPGEAGTQATSEIAYTGYARVGVARQAGTAGTVDGFLVSGATVTLALNKDFPEMTGGTGGTVTHFGIGVAASGATVLLYSGAVSPTIAVASGVTPRLKAATSVTED